MTSQQCFHRLLTTGSGQATAHGKPQDGQAGGARAHRPPPSPPPGPQLSCAASGRLAALPDLLRELGTMSAGRCVKILLLLPKGSSVLHEIPETCLWELETACAITSQAPQRSATPRSAQNALIPEPGAGRQKSATHLGRPRRTSRHPGAHGNRAARVPWSSTV